MRPLREIKSQLLALRRVGKLDRAKMLLLTNCAFDGIVYDVQRVMQECLAIKPDLVLLERRLLPDPARAYSTQSTHRTLTSLRQGSMIHVFDRDFSDDERQPRIC